MIWNLRQRVLVNGLRGEIYKVRHDPDGNGLVYDVKLDDKAQTYDGTYTATATELQEEPKIKEQ